MEQVANLEQVFEGHRGMLELAARDFLQALEVGDFSKARYELETLGKGHVDIEHEIENTD